MLIKSIPADYQPSKPVKKALKILYLQTFSPLVRKLLRRNMDRISIDSGELYELSDSKWRIEEDQEDAERKIDEYLEYLDSVEYQNIKQKKYRFREPFVAEIGKCYIIGENSTAYSGKKVVQDTIGYEKERLSYHLKEDTWKSLPETLKIFTPGRIEPEVSLERAMVMNSKYVNYFHWMLEHLLKLRGLEKYEEETKNEVKLVLPPDPPSYIKESLEIFAPGKEVVEAGKSVMEVENLVVPSFPEPTPENLKWLKEVGADERKPVEETPSRIYISRQGAGNRKVANFDEVVSVLEEFSVEPVELENYSLREQISILHNAEMVVGPHGAGFTNLVWGEDLDVIELFNRSIHQLYGKISYILGHQYSVLTGEYSGKAGRDRNKNMVIDPEKLGELLKNRAKNN